MELAKGLVKRQQRLKCDHRFQSLCGWQCINCSALNHEGVDLCDMCSRPRGIDYDRLVTPDTANDLIRNFGTFAAMPTDEATALLQALPQGAVWKMYSVHQTLLGRFNPEAAALLDADGDGDRAAAETGGGSSGSAGPPEGTAALAVRVPTALRSVKIRL